MKTLFKIVVGFLAIIGALAIALATYLYLADPLGLRELLKPAPTTQSPADSESVTIDGTQYNLSPSQKYFLEKAGIDPASLPTTISPELENCLINSVGEDRAAAIKAGDVPTITDLLKAKTCLNN